MSVELGDKREALLPYLVERQCAPDDLRRPELEEAIGLSQIALEDEYGYPLGHCTFEYADGWLVAHRRVGRCQIDVRDDTADIVLPIDPPTHNVRYRYRDSQLDGYIVEDVSSGQVIDMARYDRIPGSPMLEIVHATLAYPPQPSLEEVTPGALKLVQQVFGRRLGRAIEQAAQPATTDSNSQPEWADWRTQISFDQWGRKEIEVIERKLGRPGASVGSIREFIYNDPGEVNQRPRIKRIESDQAVPSGLLGLSVDVAGSRELTTRYFYDHLTGLLLRAETKDESGDLVQRVDIVRDAQHRISSRLISRFADNKPQGLWTERFSYQMAA